MPPAVYRAIIDLLREEDERQEEEQRKSEMKKRFG